MLKTMYTRNETFFRFFKAFKKLDVVGKALSKLKDRTSSRKPDKLRKFHYDLIEDYVCWFEEQKKFEQNNVSVKKN